MRTTLLLVLVGLLSTFSALAENSVKVIAVRGTVSSTRGAKLAIGTVLALTDKITVGNDGYVGLVHTNGRTLELRKAGTYGVRDLDKMATKKSGSVNSKFATYVVNELTETKEPIAFQDKHRANMRVTGAVERAAGDEVSVMDTLANAVGGLGDAQRLAVVAYGNVSSSATIMVVMPRSTRLLRDTVRFSWHRDPKTSEYRVRIIDRNEKTVFERTTTDTFMMVDLRQGGMAEGQLHLWHVERASDKSFHSDDYGLFRLTGADRQATEAVLSDVESDLVDPESSVSSLIMATVYEDQGLIYDAYMAFADAIAASPSVQNYKRMFAEFLRRHDLNAEAYEVYQ
ncbi:MAG: hypothetical protein JSS89_04490 [Bacteroidetes bacterium]|nr:hypothetical protein [Bacteroidota bacterium]